MKKVAALTTIVLSLTGMHGVRAAEHKESVPHKRTNGPSAGAENQRTGSVRVAPGDWGNVAPDEIEILLNAIAGEMLKHFPGHQLDPIVVLPSHSGPVVLYEKGPQHEYQILLAAKGDRWAEYVYEFSHELFHVLANYEYHAPPRQARHQWFEEMLCETVSLYMLKRFSLTWEQSPPKNEWRYYAADLQRFTQRALTEPHRQLPGNVSFQQWFQQHGPFLATKPYLREKNELVATLFLPLFEHAADWRAIAYLNLDVPQGESSFYEYLAYWYRTTPQPHRRFVGEAMSLFHFREPAEGEPLLAFETLPAKPGERPEIPQGSAGPAAR